MIPNQSSAVLQQQSDQIKNAAQNTLQDADLAQSQKHLQLQNEAKILKNPVLIKITDAEKRVTSMESYTSYQITTNESYSGTVRRRFNDFRWLHDQLQLIFPYHFLPPLPQKIVLSVDRFSPEFVESRRQALEIYLQMIADHFQSPLLYRTVIHSYSYLVL